MNLRKIQSGVLALLLLALGTVYVAPAVAQKPAARPFEPGEELTYKAEVSRSLLKKLDVATFRFVVEETASPANAHSSSVAAGQSLKFIGDVASEGFFTKLFNLKFHQHVESTVNPESLVVQKTVKLDEQGKPTEEKLATTYRKLLEGAQVRTGQGPFGRAPFEHNSARLPRGSEAVDVHPEGEHAVLAGKAERCRLGHGRRRRDERVETSEQAAALRPPGRVAEPVG